MQTISGVGIGFNRPKRMFTRTKGQARLMFKCMSVAITPDPSCCAQAAAYLDAATTPLPYICASLAPSKKKTHALPAAGRGALGMQCLQAVVDELYAHQSDSDDSDDSAWSLPAPECLDSPAPRTPLATMLEDCLLREHTARVDTHVHATEWPLDTTDTAAYVPYRFELAVRPAGVFSEEYTPVLQTTVAFLPAWCGAPTSRNQCKYGHGHFDSAGTPVERVSHDAAAPMACSRWVRRAGADGRAEWVCVVEVRVPADELRARRGLDAPFRLDAHVKLGTQACDVVSAQAVIVAMECLEDRVVLKETRPAVGPIPSCAN